MKCAALPALALALALALIMAVFTVDRVNIQGVRSVSRVLDHWGNRIFNTMRDTIINHPQDVLPDYSRIRPLSEALDDLFREVKTLKKHLLLLNERLGGLESDLTSVGFGKPLKVKRVVMRRVPQRAGGRILSRRMRLQPRQRGRGAYRTSQRQPRASPGTRERIVPRNSTYT
uniref:Uncharacterized protein n=1 Tax=Callorhinchus milii TaxID=7868 RepID=A0A4W3JRJ9_CALMI